MTAARIEQLAAVLAFLVVLAVLLVGAARDARVCRRRERDALVAAMLAQRFELDADLAHAIAITGGTDDAVRAEQLRECAAAVRAAFAPGAPATAK
ncbi:hypothetical protein amrb99_98010 [Actinomadura sp. RB99]|uniref:hypothetical protein n=1 Tax=Actinomadura sp. RB99 TaxID=2691577 RepID=UPI001687ABF0|nr:hypothetical protein [Actinomadura sp. RB99]MBD2900792.1 hypothetical protein [Actinomadura sp. RB99]